MCFGWSPKSLKILSHPSPTLPQGGLGMSREAKSAIWGAAGTFPRAAPLQELILGSSPRALARVCAHVSSTIWNSSADLLGSTGSGVKKCGSDPPFHARWWSG